MAAARPAPFDLKDCDMITMALGRGARNLRELRQGVEQVPVGSIYHHFFHTLLRHTFDDPEYRNDFALWARRQLHDFHLAERLDVVDPIDFPDLEDLRRHLLGILDARLEEAAGLPEAGPGRPFQFLRSQMVVFATELRAENPSQLKELAPRLSTGSVFFHFIEARRRPPERVDDFSAWLQAWGDSTRPARRRLAGIDYHLWTLSEMKELIARSLSEIPEPA